MRRITIAVLTVFIFSIFANYKFILTITSLASGTVSLIVTNSEGVITYFSSPYYLPLGASGNFSVEFMNVGNANLTGNIIIFIKDLNLRIVSTLLDNSFVLSPNTARVFNTDFTPTSSGTFFAFATVTYNNKIAERGSSFIVPIPFIAINETITKPEIVQEIIAHIRPADLGITEINISHIDIKKINTAETTTTAVAQLAGTLIDDVLPNITNATSKEILKEMKSFISTGRSVAFSTNTRVDVFEIKENTTGNTTFVSKIAKTIQPTTNLEDVKIVEVIPKSVATNISQIRFLGEQPKVLQSDPIVQWEFSVVQAGEKKDLSYQVNKKVETVDIQTIAITKASTAESTTTTTSAGSAGGGGAASKKINLTVDYPTQLKLSRGQSSLIPISVKNDGETDLNNLILFASASGVSLNITPTTLAMLKPTSSFVFLISVEAPEDLPSGKYTLHFTLASDKTTKKGEIKVEIEILKIEVEINESIKNYEATISNLYQEVNKASTEGRDVSSVVKLLDETNAKLNVVKELYISNDYISAKVGLESIKQLLEQATIQLAETSRPAVVFVPIPFPRPEIVASLTGTIGLSAYYYYRRKKEEEKYRKSIRSAVDIIKKKGKS